MKASIKKQDWSDFDKLMEELGNSAIEAPERKTKDDIKSRILGSDVMTDAQHRMIIAIFVNELDWTAHDAFKFIIKVMPLLRSRLKKRVIQETDIQALYQELKKKEASKLINILKSITKRSHVKTK